MMIYRCSVVRIAARMKINSRDRMRAKLLAAHLTIYSAATGLVIFGHISEAVRGIAGIVMFAYMVPTIFIIDLGHGSTDPWYVGMIKLYMLGFGHCILWALLLEWSINTGRSFWKRR